MKENIIMKVKRVVSLLMIMQNYSTTFEVVRHDGNKPHVIATGEKFRVLWDYQQPDTYVIFETESGDIDDKVDVATFINLLKAVEPNFAFINDIKSIVHINSDDTVKRLITYGDMYMVNYYSDDIKNCITVNKMQKNNPIEL